MTGVPVGPDIPPPAAGNPFSPRLAALPRDQHRCLVVATLASTMQQRTQPKCITVALLPIGTGAAGQWTPDVSLRLLPVRIVEWLDPNPGPPGLTGARAGSSGSQSPLAKLKTAPFATSGQLGRCRTTTGFNPRRTSPGLRRFSKSIIIPSSRHHGAGIIAQAQQVKEELNERLQISSQVTPILVSRFLHSEQARWPTVFVQGRLYWTRSLGIRSTLHPHINPQSHAHTPPQPLPDFIYATTNGEVCGSVGNKPAGSSSIGPVQLIRPKGVSTRCQEPALSAPSPTFIHPPDQEVGRPRNSHSGRAWGCRVATRGRAHHPRNTLGWLPCHASITPLLHLSRWRTTFLTCYWFPDHARSR